MHKTKLFLTSIAAIMLATPAFATVGDATFTENQTNQPSCQIDILGVDESTANANATWSPNAYTCLMGTYLPAGNDWTTDSSPFANDPDGYASYANNSTYPLACQPCPANSYCPGNVGGTQWTYSATTAQGATACSGNYTLSDAGSMTQGQCYHNCTAAETGNIKTNGTVTGRVYQSGLNTCEPSDQNQCAGGYHYVAGQSPVLPDTATNADDAQYVPHMGSGDNTDNDLTAGEWKVSWTSGNGTKGTLKGIASCNTISGTHASSTGSSASMTNGVTGRRCWCKTTSWTPSGGTELRVSSAWVFLGGNDYGVTCAYNCADFCADSVRSHSDFRPALFEAVGASPAQCAANTITLNWGGYGANNDQSQQTTCTYGGTIDTPTTAPTKRGHTFTGWHFVAPSNN